MRSITTPGASTRPGLTILRQRAIQAVSVALFVSTLSFLLLQRLPGDIAFRIAAGRYGYDQVSTASADALRADLGLERPVLQQLLSWWGDLARFDLGSSLVTDRPIVDELPLYLSSTLQLTAVTLVVAFAVGAILGGIAEVRSGGLLDRAITGWIALTRAMPPFLLGLLLILAFSVHLGLLPATGHGQPHNIVLPATTLAIGLSGLFARITRDTVHQIRASDYVGFAATKGLGARLVFLRHVLRNAGVTLIAYVGVQALILIEGVLVVELVFSWPGLGHALVHAIFWRDIPMLQATVLVLGLLVVALNTVVDLAGVALDPRPRSRQVVS